MYRLKLVSSENNSGFEGLTATGYRDAGGTQEERMWLKHDKDNSVVFCGWCRRFDKN